MKKSYVFEDLLGNRNNTTNKIIAGKRLTYKAKEESVIHSNLISKNSN